MRRRKTDKEFTNNSYSPFTAKNKKQKEYLNYLDSFIITIAHGAAGTGKTACAVSKACEHLYTGQIEKIVISRPAVEAGENLGFLPGELEDKYEPWMAPVRCIMNDILGKSTVDAYIKGGKVEAVPLAHCRGRTFNDSFIILDEAQNTTVNQMKMFLTRIGHGSKMAITGDTAQTDISGRNGLEDVVKRIAWMPSVKIMKFNRDDIVRNSIISDILQAYDDPIS